MALTMWRNTTTGHRLDRAELQQFHERAQVLYRCNPHIFEDERDALVALGVEPIAATLDQLDLGPLPLANGRAPAGGLAASVARFLGGALT